MSISYSKGKNPKEESHEVQELQTLLFCQNSSGENAYHELKVGAAASYAES